MLPDQFPTISDRDHLVRWQLR